MFLGPADMMLSPPQSFTTINNMLWNFYDSIYNAKSDIESSVAAISSTFAPMDQGGLPIDIIIDIVTMG